VRRGSALLLALWIIAVLAVMVLSFATEAHYESGINVYIRERNRVNRLIDAGKVIGEIVICDYENVEEWSEDQDEKDMDEKDRWYKFKQDLKEGRPCKIGPVLLDEEDPDSGTVTVEIEVSDSGCFNINRLYSGGEGDYILIWQMVLKASGIDEELEVEVKEADGRSTKRHNLMNLLIASWNDWRDTDDTVCKGPITDDGVRSEEDDGAEADFYKEQYEELEKSAHGRDEREAVKEKRITPPNAAIKDLKELEYVRGFKDFPAVLVGGRLYPEEEVSEENPEISPVIMRTFGVNGSAKLIINPDTKVETLMMIPGISNAEEDDDEDQAEARERAEAIISTLSVPPDDRDDYDKTRTWWPYKDWSDLRKRVEDASNVDDIGEDASKYIEFKPGSDSVFTMKITGESMGMKHTVSCQCYVKDKKVRYIEWSEDADEATSSKK